MKDKRTSILLIGMNGDTSDSFMSAMMEYSYNITSIDSGIRNLSYDLYAGFDCLIVDYHVWRDPGFDAEKTFLKKMERTVPVIFAGELCEDSVITDSFKKGADDFISIPFRSCEISARIDNQVFLSRARKNLFSEMERKTTDLTMINTLLNESVNEYKHILKDLQENETLLLTIALNIPNSYLAIVEKNFTIGFAAGQEFKKNNLDPWSLVGLSLEKVFREKSEFVKKNIEKSFNGSENTFELNYKNQFLIYNSVPLFNSGGEVQRVLVVAENITEHKASEYKIRESLKEKEILLKEIHHRVKNNMQLVCSMISLQADCIDDRDVYNMFKVLQSRIFSMSLVHEKLYQHKHFSKINFRNYVKELVAEIKNSFSGNSVNGNMDIELMLHDESFEIDKAIPCGLILNELIMNAIKHASITSGRGIIKIIFEKTPSGSYRLVVKDNGRGLPEGFNINSADSMGMLLVRELVGQLKGEISVESDAETVFTINFGDRYQNTSAENVIAPVIGRRNILLVEDERIISRMLRKCIEEEGYNIIDTVPSGRDAIISALKNTPDLIIMDIMLEDDIDGVKAASEIMKVHNCPIIFLTGNSDPATLRSARDIKPFDMLTKPVEKKQIIRAIESAFRYF